MAETTITGLPNATTPLSGSERLPMDQAGATKDATAQDIANLAPATNLTFTAATQTLASSTGADVVLPVATTTAAGLESAADKTKLDSITVDSATLVRKLVRNNSGATIPKGAVIYQTGSSGIVITVALADASGEATAAQTLGMTQEAIGNNANGYVVAVGELTGVNTSTLIEGQIAWLSETAGQLTATKPTAPAHGVVIGYCVKQGAGTAGILYVKVDNGMELDELHDVLISSPTAGQVLRRASDGLWKNAQLAAADISGLGTAASTASTDYAPSASGVTNGNSHDHNGGDGAQIAYSSLSGLPALPTGTNTGDQTLSNTSNATSHTVTLSGSGGSLQLVEGSNITLTTSGTGAAGVVTIDASVTGGGGGTVTSIGLVVPLGFSVSGSPVTTSGNITLAFAAGYSLPATTSQTSWDTAFTERRYWDGGSTGLTASTGRASLELTSLATATVGSGLSISGGVLSASGGGGTFTGYAVNSWLVPFSGSLANSTTVTANSIVLIPFYFLRTVTIDEIAARIITGAASASFALAIYANANGQPTGTPIASTGSLNAGTAATVSAPLTAATYQANATYWAASNSNGSPVYSTLPAGGLHSVAVVGALTAGDAIASGNATFFGRAIAQTFGTWPDLTDATMTVLGSSTRRGPIIATHISALP